MNTIFDNFSKDVNLSIFKESNEDPKTPLRRRYLSLVGLLEYVDIVNGDLTGRSLPEGMTADDVKRMVSHSIGDLDTKQAMAQGAQGNDEGTQGTQGNDEGTQGTQGNDEGTQGTQGNDEGTQGTQGNDEGTQGTQGNDEGTQGTQGNDEGTQGTQGNDEGTQGNDEGTQGNDEGTQGNEGSEDTGN